MKLRVLYLILTTMIFYCMKQNLSNDIEKMLQDIPALNKKIANEGLNLSNVVINQKTLNGLIVNNSVWKNVDLKSVEGVGVVFKGCTFEEFNIIESNMLKCTFENCIFKNCIFTTSGLSGAFIKACQFTSGSLNDMDFSDIFIEQSNIIDTKINEVVGYDTKMKSVTFDKCFMEHTAFPRAEVENLKIFNVNIKALKFRGCKISKSSFNFQGDGISFARSSISDCIFNGTGSVSWFDFEKVSGNNIKFDNFNDMYSFGFPDAAIDSIEIRNTNADWVVFYNAKISNALFENLQLVSDRYDGATLTNCTYRNVVFGEDQSFDSTTLESVKFENITKKTDYKPSFKETVFKNTERF